MTDEIRCEHCEAAMTPEDETCPSCGRRQGVDAAPETREHLLETISRLERERDAAIATTEDARRLRGILDAVATALTECRFVGGQPANADLGWIYKARGALVAAGYGIPHPVDDDHPRHAARLAEAALAAGDAHLHQFWSTHATPTDAERPAYMKIVGDLCERCDGFGGAPERIRLLARLIVERERDLASATSRLEAVSAHAREQANQIDDDAAARAELATALAEERARYQILDAAHAAAKARIETMTADGRERDGAITILGERVATAEKALEAATARPPIPTADGFVDIVRANADAIREILK